MPAGGTHACACAETLLIARTSATRSDRMRRVPVRFNRRTRPSLDGFRFQELGAVREQVVDRAERPSLDQLHGDVRLPVSLADFVHGADVRMVEGSSGACFTHQPGARGEIVESGGWQYLDRDVSIKLLVAGAIHLSHATSAQSADDAVVRQPPAIQCVAPTSGQIAARAGW